MKVWDTALLASFILSGACTVPNQSPIRILGAVPLQTGPSSGAGGCQAVSGLNTPGGSLDISGSIAYLVQFNVASDLQSISTVVPPDTIDTPNRNTFYASQLAYSYTSTPSLNLPPESIAYYYVIPPNSTGGAIRPDLITYNAAQQLVSNVRRGDVYSLDVTIQLQGQLASGQKLSSNKVTYNIDVYNSGFPGCARGDVQVPSGPCGLPGGQDGTLVGCCSQITPKPSGCP
jgi:hypothetical protein